MTEDEEEDAVETIMDTLNSLIVECWESDDEPHRRIKIMADFSHEIQKVYRRLSDLMYAGKFNEVVKILEELDIVETSPTLLVTYVSAAHMARDEYPEAYAKFFYEVEDIVQIIGEPDALFGLEPKIKEETQ